MNINRRGFLKASFGSAALLTLPHMEGRALPAPANASALFTLSNTLVQTWGDKLLSMQVTDALRTADYGGIFCPADQAVHGRCADAIYPFFFLARKNNDHRYIDAAVLLYKWLETHVSQDDGAWLNEPIKGSWKGTTVFTAIALAETLKHYGALMDPAFKIQVTDRLRKAGEFIHTNFTIDYGNINYPITASYGLSLLGELLDIQQYKTHGRELAHQALKFITPHDNLLSGEGDPYDVPSAKGCFSVDLGYNVEESLPSLVSYGLLTHDEEVLQSVTASLQAHLEFMLPDGAWDNSWGTRNYKWTYWGSRTTDGAQPAYAQLSGRDARFYTVALRNTQLLHQHTHEGLLYGGPHYLAHGVAPCVHHTFCHIKALATLASSDSYQHESTNPLPLPRDKAYGYKFFSDIQTWLVATGKFRATVTAYDREYKKTRNGHATGGAITMLWHEHAGVILCGSMNAYQRFEAGNMQPDTDPLSMPLTPRLELRVGNTTYMNICDLRAAATVTNRADDIHIETRARLVDQDQNNPPGGEVRCKVLYVFSGKGVTIDFNSDSATYPHDIKVIVPIVAAAHDKVVRNAANRISVEKSSVNVFVTGSKPLDVLPTTAGRVFNFVPGFEAVPVVLPCNTRVTISTV